MTDRPLLNFDLEKAIALRWALRDIAAKRLKLAPLKQDDLQTLIDLARRLSIKTVAEWVQDEESALMLRDWGCDYIQGRLIGLASSQKPWDEPATAVLPAAS